MKNCEFIIDETCGITKDGYLYCNESIVELLNVGKDVVLSKEEIINSQKDLICALKQKMQCLEEIADIRSWNNK